ncbi:glycosyltransferase [Photobacterium damselae]|uniref:glycosyltransferase n=1 Tax=Photobacterium damselae TaxID=38293 RepID=UPI001F42A24E|nr:glycosyltransferase [Photobacterium damselae]UKA02550.1 glycosyltransferase [Photobacterium damselae subsp. damselae]
MSVYAKDNALMLTEAINSIYNQTVPCDIFIFLDGELPLELNEVIDKYSCLDNIYIFSSKVNIGLARALNNLINISIQRKYNYIARMDSDDLSRPDRIEKQLQFFHENLDIDVLGTSCREFGASFALDEKHLPQTHEELLNFSITRCPFIHPSVMFRASVFAKGHRYPENTTLTEDMALWFQLLNDGIRFANLNEVLLDYRLNENTIYRRKGLKKAMSEINIRTKNMLTLKQVNFKNISLIGARIVFHLLPSTLVKLAYKKAR